MAHIIAGRAYQALKLPAVLASEARAWRQFWASFQEYSRLAPPRARPQARYLYPCIHDRTSTTPIEPIYFYQDAWAFEQIVAARPSRHVDVGSHHKYVALLSKVVPLTMVDVRPLALRLASISFLEGSILAMPFEDQSVLSLSSLCVVEHIGLGRYGDPLDWQGSEKAIAELKRVLAPGGDLYVSLPLDVEDRVYFNAHRAFREETLERWFRPLEIVDRAYIRGTTFSSETDPGQQIGCFHLRRAAP
jgi:SAM-dependent methyltransferase